MAQLNRHSGFLARGWIIVLTVGLLIGGLMAISYDQTVRAAACAAPASDYGVVSHTINVPEVATYRIWTRMAAPDSTRNTYMLEVDGAECFEVGGSAVPVYTNSSGPYFVNNSSNWRYQTTEGVSIDINLASGNHQLRLIGTHADVVIDRLIITQDTACVPTGDGDNCASEFFVADINQDGVVDFLDFSALASGYGQSGGSVGRRDINRDGTVNFLDFSLLSGRYGK